MQLIRLIKQTLVTLSKHMFRTILSVTGIILGVAAVVSMLSIGEGAKKEILKIIEQLGKNNVVIRYVDPGKRKREENPRGISEEDVLLISKNFQNILVAPSKDVAGILYEKNDRAKVEVMAVSPTYRRIRNLDLYKGRFICDLDLKQKNLVCVLGYDVAKAIDALGKELHRININQKLFHVIGILAPREIQKKNVPFSIRDYNQAIFIPLGTENSITAPKSTKYDGIGEVILKLLGNQDITSFGNVMRNFFLKRHHNIEDFQVVIPQELLGQEQQAQRTFNIALATIAALSLLIGGIGIMNIMLAIVTERTQEIGIRRAIGANKTHIMLQFLMEALTLTSIGTGLGLILGILIAILIGHLAHWNVIITFWSLLIATAMSSISGLVSGLYPAYIASNMDPISALRQK